MLRQAWEMTSGPGPTDATIAAVEARQSLAPETVRQRAFHARSDLPKPWRAKPPATQPAVHSRERDIPHRRTVTEATIQLSSSWAEHSYGLATGRT